MILKADDMYLDGFETKRLIIRPVAVLDKLIWTDFFIDNSEYEYIGLDPDVSPCDHSDKWIERQLKRYAANDYGLMALVEKENMEMVGQCGLITMNTEHDRELELGYHIIEKYRRKGYAREAAGFFMDYVFKNNLADTFLAVIHVNNVKSQALAMKLGMRKERETLCMNKPSYRYVITHDEWKKLPR